MAAASTNKREINDVITSYNTGAYSSIIDLYEILVDPITPEYILSVECLDDVFTNPQTLTYATCGDPWTNAINLLYSQYTDAQVILAFELFGYDYAFYSSDCDDNGGCLCDNRNFNGRNIISKRKYGVLTDNGYLDNNYSREYLMQLHYDETENCIYISDEHSMVNPAYNTAYLNLNPEYYRKKLVMTYVGFDRDTAKFLEQIVLDQDHEIDGIWKYDLGDTDCAHNNQSVCLTEDGYTNITMVVEYVNDLGFLSQTEVSYPIINSNIVNITDGKIKLDGIYKTYYFDIPYLTYFFLNTSNSGVFKKGTIYYFEYEDFTLGTVKEYCILNQDITVDYTTTEITIQGSVFAWDLLLNDDIVDFKETYFTVASGIDFLKNLGTFKNTINASSSLIIDGYVGEDSHLITYNLRDNIIDSIQDCNVPCERFSFDTWVALMQKKMAASIAFCNNNLQESARIISTVEERCKNCD